MKYLKKFKMFESLKTGYSYQLVNGDDFITSYEFSDDSNNKFLVQFKNDKIGPVKSPRLSKTYELCYYVWDDDINDWSVSKIVNANIWMILQTVLGDILNDFISRKSWVSIIRIEGLSKETQKTFISQRTKIYLRYLRSNPIKGYDIEYFGSNKINLVKK